MSEFINRNLEIGGQVLAEHVDRPGEQIPFTVVHMDTDVKLRSKGIGDVLIDLERFLREGTSPRGRLRFAAR